MKLQILWASMYGTAEGIAFNLKELAEAKGIETQIEELNDFSVADLKTIENLAVVSSTTGSGDVPANGELFWSEFEDSSDLLETLNYGVCALGDSSYITFCRGGKKINEKLKSLKANEIIECAECDGGDEGSEEWCEAFLDKLLS